MSKILIIEDDESLRDMYKEEFEFEKFVVETAIDGMEGIEKIVSFMPDIVLLDLMMPKMSGFDVLKIVKEKPLLKKIPIIVFTNINADVQDLLKNWGVAGFLLKTDNTPGEVVEKVRAFLNSKN